MSIFIKRGKAWLERHPKTKQWLWFTALWCGGILTAITISYPIKLLIKSASS
jgi:hypothetical protein